MRRHVVMIAVSNYRDDRYEPLPSVLRDAERLRRVLEDLADGGVHRMEWLPDEHATKADIVAALKKVAKDASDTDQVILYFGGHGSRGRDQAKEISFFSFVPYDATWDGGSDELLQMTEIGKLVHKIRARQLIIIFDFCHAGGMGAGFDWWSSARQAFEGWTNVYGLAAARGYEDALEDDTSGFFLSALTNALQGKGNVTIDRTGRISIQAAWVAAADVTQSRALRYGRDQHATSFGAAGLIFVTRVENPERESQEVAVRRWSLPSRRGIGASFVVALVALGLLVAALRFLTNNVSLPSGPVQASAAAWEGSWQQTFVGAGGAGFVGRMQLRPLDSATVVGEFESQVEQRRYKGELRGISTPDGILEGTWSNEYGQRGSFLLELQTDGLTFRGTYAMGDESPRTKAANTWTGTKLVESAPLPTSEVLDAPGVAAPRVLTASLDGQDLRTCTQSAPCTTQMLNPRHLLNIQLDRHGYACVIVTDLRNSFPQPPGIIDGIDAVNPVSFGGRGLFTIIVITSATAITCEDTAAIAGGRVQGYVDVR